MSLNVETYDLADRHGPVLAKRDEGRIAGRQAVDRLLRADCLVLNFHGADVATPPFLSELMRALRAVLLDRSSGRWLVAVGLENEDVFEPLELVLAQQKMQLGALDDREVLLLGGNRQLNETLREAQHLGSFTAPELAGRLNVKLPALHQRLNVLSAAGVLAEVDWAPQSTRAKTFSVPPEAVQETAARLGS